MDDALYFDHAAATPLDPAVLEVMLPYFSEQFYNPSAMYGRAQNVAKDIAAARAVVGNLLGAHPSEVIFTAGGTEANNLAIRGVMEHYPGKNMITTAIEHDSVLAPARLYATQVLPVRADGRIDAESIRTAINDDTVLVSIQYANNEIGTVQPISDIGQIIKEIKVARRESGNEAPLFFHTDACQVPLYLDVHVSRLGVDLLTLNGGKMYGPKQSGMLYVARDVVLAPLILGGGQERNIRSGTENVASMIGFAKALEMAQVNRKVEGQRLGELRDYCMAELAAQIPMLEINGSKKYRLPNNVHVTIQNADNERLLFELDETGIMAAAGSACSASSDEPSHVLTALGCSTEMARSSLRFTFGHSTDKAAIDTLVESLVKLIKK